MSNSLPLQIAETIQTASLNRAPSPTHDVNPSTSSSAKVPVKIAPLSDSSIEKYTYSDSGIEDDEEDIPVSVLKPTPRRQSFGPLPDLRFEQSYLASIAGAETRWRIVYITARDQILLPLLQGTLWTLALHGWRHWNRSATLSGHTVGSRLRRWWYTTNNWKIPELSTDMAKNKKLAREMGDVSFQYLMRFLRGRGWGFVWGWRLAGGTDVWSFC